MDRKARWLSPLLALSVFALSGCGTDDAEGDTVGSCTVVDLGDGTSAIRCPDGSELVVPKGKDGKDGRDGADGEDGESGEKGDPGDKGDPGEKGEDAACTLEEVDGAHVLTCGDKSVVLGDSCADGFPFDVVVTDDDADAAKTLVLFQASNCTWIRGNVRIEHSGADVPKALQRVETIDGSFDVENAANVEELTFPRLREIGGQLFVRNNDGLAVASFPSLETVGDQVYVYGNGALATLSFPSLKTIGARFVISRNDALTSIDGFPALESVGKLFVIQSNSSLTTIGNFVALKRINSLSIMQNDALESVAEFPALEEITYDPVDYVFALFVAWNEVLTSFGKLGSVSAIPGDVGFMGNPELPHEDIEELLDGVAISGETEICENQGGPAC